MIFHDRYDAGRQLAATLMPYAGRKDVIVLALPRGGVPVGFEVAQALGVPLDLLLVRKLGVPGQEELAMGAIASGGVRVFNPRVMEMVQPSDEVVDRITEKATRELERREQVYRNNRPLPDVRGRTVLLVDDGLATGSTMKAAITAVQNQEPASLVVAVPVCSSNTCDELRGQVDRVICLTAPDPFYAVGQCYQDFSQTTDAVVLELMARQTRLSDATAYR
jgi:putative phosphoribosyl transferase